MVLLENEKLRFKHLREISLSKFLQNSLPLEDSLRHEFKPHLLWGACGAVSVAEEARVTRVSSSANKIMQTVTNVNKQRSITAISPSHQCCSLQEIWISDRICQVHGATI